MTDQDQKGQHTPGIRGGDPVQTTQCQCPTCGRIHWSLGFGKPPAARREADLLGAALAVLRDLREWESNQGGYEAPCWDAMRAVLAKVSGESKP